MGRATPQLHAQVQVALNKVSKWRAIFAGWQVGSRPTGDPECDALRDNAEVRILMRVELSAVTRLLLEKGILDEAEFFAQLLIEAEELDKMYQQKFPGMKASSDGMVLSPEAYETMKSWKP